MLAPSFQPATYRHESSWLCSHTFHAGFGHFQGMVGPRNPSYVTHKAAQSKMTLTWAAVVAQWLEQLSVNLKTDW